MDLSDGRFNYSVSKNQFNGTVQFGILKVKHNNAS